MNMYTYQPPTTEEEIRRLYLEGGLSQAKIAENLGCSDGRHGEEYQRCLGSFRFAQGRAGWISDSEKCSLAASSLTWNGKVTRPQTWQRGLAKHGWTRLLFGLIYPLSTAGPFMAAWILSLQASPARRSPSPASAKESKTSAGSGPMYGAWYARREQGCWRLRTSLDLFPQEMPSDQSSPTWPKAGGVRNGYVFERPTWAPAMSGIAGSAWPTPQAHDVAQGNPERVGRYGTAHGGRNLTDDAANWMTPRGSDGEKGRPNQRGSKGDMMLPSQAAHWLTPNVPNGGRVVSAETVEAKGMTPEGKRSQTRNWPTPDARRAKLKAEKMNGNGIGEPLAMATQRWPTATAGDANSSGSRGYQAETRNEGTTLTDATTRGYSAASLLAPAPRNGLGSFKPTRSRSRLIVIAISGKRHYKLRAKAALLKLRRVVDDKGQPTVGSFGRGRLNAWFVEWLLGWQEGLTAPEPSDCASAETESYPTKQQQPSESLIGVTKSQRVSEKEQKAWNTKHNGPPLTWLSSRFLPHRKRLSARR